jgi:hypothetical protein
MDKNVAVTDTYDVVHDSRDLAGWDRHSARRSRSQGQFKILHPQRSDCSHNSFSSDKTDSDHLHKWYRHFNSSTCHRDEVKVRVGDYKSS